MIGRFLIGFTGLVVLVHAGALVWFSDQLTPGVEGGPPGDVILLFVGLTLAVSLLHIVACLAAHRDPPRVFFILFIGAVARLIMLFGAPGPMLEGDHDRIRFDARMVNRGVNPYAYLPQDLYDDAGEDYLRLEFIEREFCTRETILERTWTDEEIRVFVDGLAEFQALRLPRQLFSWKQRLLGSCYPVWRGGSLRISPTIRASTCSTSRPKTSPRW